MSQHDNGHRPRNFHTRVGTLALLIPRDREGHFCPTLFARYQRSEKALVLALQEMVLQGVSTRKVRKITERKNCAAPPSARTRSRSWLVNWMRSWPAGGADLWKDATPT